MTKKSENYKYAVGEIVCWAYPLTEDEKKYKGKHVTITRQLKGNDNSTIPGYEVQVNKDIFRVVLETELDTATAKSKVKLPPVPVSINNEEPVKNDTSEILIIDGEPYMVKAYGQKLSDGSRQAILEPLQ